MNIVMAQINPIIGDLAGNTKAVIDIINHTTSKEDIDFLVFPEMTISGYPPLDLVDRPGFVDEQLEYLELIKKATLGTNFCTIVGAVTKNEGVGKPLFNSLFAFTNGFELTKYNKVLLPTYNIFDESRHFEPGDGHGNIIFYKGKRIALFICEDGWANCPGRHIYHTDPVGNSVDGEVDLIISINASPSNVFKYELRKKVFSETCKKYGIPLIYVNQVGGQDGVVFDGASFAMNKTGDIVVQLPLFEECIKTFNLETEIEKDNKFPGISEEEFFYKQIKLGIQDYIKKTGCFKGVVVGSSGGIDSALVLAIAVDALGADNVKAITMPSKVSSAGSVTDSEKLCKNLGIELFNFPIRDSYELFMDNFDSCFQSPKLKSIDQNKVTEQNAQSNLRGMTLMRFSNRFGYLVLNTGNKSELSTGYFTLGGDSMGGIAPIADLYKMQVFAVSRYYNKLHGAEIIPVDIIDKEPSAELAEGQKDSNELPVYPVLDPILRVYIESDSLPESVMESCKETIKKMSSKSEVEKVIRLTVRNEHKRKVVPHGIHLNSVPYGKAWVMPIAQKYVPYKGLINTIWKE